MRWYNRLSTKLALAVVAAVGISVLAFGLFVSRLTYVRLEQEAKEKSEAAISGFQRDLETVDSLMLGQLQSAMRVLKQEGQNLGEPSVGGTIKVADKIVPDLLFGKNAQANNYVIVDRVKQLMGGTATLFVRNGSEFVRVSTNVLKPDGSRAVGTTLNPDGKAIAAVREGKSFYGVVDILDKPYITGYEPIKTVDGDIVGAWYVGYELSALEEIRRKGESISFLETGFLVLIDDQNKVVFKSKNAPPEMIEKLVQAKSDVEIDGWNVTQSNFEPWDYKIFSAYSNNDPELREQIFASNLRIIGGDLMFLVFLAALIILLTRYFIRPLDDVARAADEISQGKLDIAISARSKDEIGNLARSMQLMIDYLREMSSVADKIAAGNLNVEVHPRSSEDRFGLAFQNMLERTLRLVQTQDERNRLQRSIMKLLEEVSDVAEGDLTAEAKVTADATGAIADAFNYMIVELRTVIGRVKRTSVQVDASTAQVQTTTGLLVRRSEQQSIQLSTLSSALEHLTTTMQQVAEETTASARASGAALTNAKQGTSVVNNSISAMNRLRSRVQETSERIKRLGERSQEISSIVKIINDLAQRTSVLALNASIQATAAGQAGRGFAAVAEEVERLAVRSSTASKQIDALTKAIQGETEEAVISMETTVKEVAVGVKLTGEVGETLGVIESVTRQLSDISSSVAASARQQAESSADISGTMRSVSTNSQQNALDMKESAGTVNQLAVWTQDLRESVASFKLPDSDEPADIISISSNNGANIGVGV